LEDTVKINKVTLGFTYPFFFGSFCMLLDELGFTSFEFFLARNAAKMVGFAFICNFILGGAFI